MSGQSLNHLLHLEASRCHSLTVGQKCADWFVMRQFRVTETNAGKTILSNNNFRSCDGIHGM